MLREFLHGSYDFILNNCLVKCKNNVFYLPSDKVLKHFILSHKMSNDGTEDSVKVDKDNDMQASKREEDVTVWS